MVALLERIGAPAGPLVLERLPGLRWSLVRPLLAALGRHPEWESGFIATQWMDHPDAAIRREALRQLLRSVESRDAAIVRALADADEANVRLGLGAAMTNCPRDAALVLRTRADEALLSADLRALGVRALSSNKNPDTPSWLAGRVVKIGKLLKREALVSKSPEMLAALEGLAIHWRDHPAARTALALATSSADAEIVGAATMTARQSGAIAATPIEATSIEATPPEATPMEGMPVIPAPEADAE
jgi:hypothetical protein